MRQQHDRASSRAGRAITRGARWILTGAASLQLTGCSTLTEVSAPDVVQPTALENPTGGLALWAGAVSRTTTALTQTVVFTGELSDELLSAAAAGSDPDKRRLPDPAVVGAYPYTAMHAARGNILQAIGVLERVAPKPASRIGQLFSLMGYIELSFAEQVCSGVPLGTIQDGQDVPGQPLTTAQMYGRAIADFDSALVYAVDSARIGNLARVGRGRAYLQLGQLPAARAAVATVPTTYVYRTENSVSVQPNAVFDAINNSKRSTVADREGLNGLNFRSASDPRVPTQLLGKGADGVTDLYAFTPYSSLASPIVLASGVEARLIEAEASLGGGSATDALASLNALRANAPGLPPLSLQSDDAGRVDQLFRERAFWFFLTAHRQGDLRRLVRQYGRVQDTVFPTGPYKGGATYGSDVNFTPEFAQRSNPNFHGCLDRAP